MSVTARLWSTAQLISFDSRPVIGQTSLRLAKSATSCGSYAEWGLMSAYSGSRIIAECALEEGLARWRLRRLSSSVREKLPRGPQERASGGRRVEVARACHSRVGPIESRPHSVKRGYAAARKWCLSSPPRRSAQWISPGGAMVSTPWAESMRAALPRSPSFRAGQRLHGLVNGCASLRYAVTPGSPTRLGAGLRPLQFRLRR